MPALILKKTDVANPYFLQLIKKLDIDLAEKDGDEAPFFAALNTQDAIHHVLVAYQNNEPVGCGAFKIYDTETVEIKRMFVEPKMRGMGIATNILNELQAWAQSLTYSSCILETGIKMKAAIALYQANGFQVIANYGPYVHVATSICFKRAIN
ncbi:GNAT family N-acetyltransferase [Flavobacterium agricola]|uniref:GNAT family N-acetyltransferase n=1 Tax=Flavobacterium agricola TaxID=2870839 RepID=A0ABY6M1B5_9FLAO|nr:GNAT family N-acetyltransferase [Flavobacterium agricola]UYW02321.1 GNAT family N-acetyltransferase [Flavobacterium agricola]